MLPVTNGQKNAIQKILFKITRTQLYYNVLVNSARGIIAQIDKEMKGTQHLETHDIWKLNS